LSYLIEWVFRTKNTVICSATFPTSCTKERLEKENNLHAVVEYMSRFYNIPKVLVTAFLSGIEPHRICKGYCDILLKSEPRQPRTPVKRPFESYNQPLSPERRDEPGGLLWTNVAHCESENQASSYPRDHNDGICQADSLRDSQAN
jgi:hypothetical protein